MSKFVVRSILVVALFALPLFADTPTYNRSTEVTLEGSVLYVGEGPLGVYVIMKDRAELSGQVNEITVLLAQSDVLSGKGIVILAGDKIRVVGSRVKWQGTETILAREILHKGKTATLREKG